jgi:hypothetical protein
MLRLAGLGAADAGEDAEAAAGGLLRGDGVGRGEGLLDAFLESLRKNVGTMVSN